MDQRKRTPVRDIGFTVVYEPQDVEPIADILLVHGLQGHPKRTWTFVPTEKSRNTLEATRPRTPNGPSISRWRNSLLDAVSNTFRRSHSSKRTWDDGFQTDEGVYWPLDLLPFDCPNVRVIVWGYDSIVTKGYEAANKTNLFGHAKDLLYSLERDRTPGRNIVFVAHSLGGLIVKEVLRRSQHAEDESLRDVINCTKGVVFLGTPHRGSSDFAKLGDVMRRVAGSLLRADNNGTIIRALGVDSPELELSRESFIQQWRTFRFQVKTFQESLPMTGIGVGILNEKIVPDISSSLDDPRERAESINANHKDMARFSGKDDVNYRKVSSELKRIVNSFNDKPRVMTPTEIECLDTLAFPAMTNREQNIQEALEDTCAWFNQSVEYIHWRQRNHVDSTRGLLWVKGKPGSGKSTLMKGAFQQVREVEGSNATVAGFFFNARGSELERTPLGFLRSIVHQLCRQDTVVMGEFLKLYQHRKVNHLSSQPFKWSRPELEGFLKQLFKRHTPKKTIIFCDALDECEEDTVREIVYLFVAICELSMAVGLDLNVCLSSRHYPTISIDYCPEIFVERKNQVDIATYVHARFRVIEKSEQDTVNQLVSELIERSSGVFLWAVIVSDMLLQDLNTGQPVDFLLQRLRRVPSDMEELYSALCDGLKPGEREVSILLFQWVLLADLEMSVEDTVLAVLLSRAWTWESLTSWGYTNDEAPPTQRLQKYIRNASRGLIEYKTRKRYKSPNGRMQTSVQFIHETVREFFLTGRGLQLVDPTLSDRPIGHSHLAIVRGAIEFIENRKDLPSFEAVTSYCQRSILEHAREAEEQGVSSIILLERLESLYAKEGNFEFISFGPGREPSLNATILHLMTRGSLPSCVEACLERGDPVDNSGMPFMTPLIASVSEDRPPSEAVVLLLLNNGANINARTYRKDTLLLVSLRNAHWKIAGLLLDRGADASATNYHNENALHVLAHRASTNDNEAERRSVMKRLVEISKTLETQTITRSTPLHIASFYGHVDAVKLLLRKEVDVNVENSKGPPLMNVLRYRGHEAYEIANLLIQHGANVHFKDKSSRTLLHHAAFYSRVEIVKLLIDTGIEVDATDDFGQTALHRVAERGASSTNIIRALVEAGCSVTARDYKSRTPLEIRRSVSQRMSHEEVELLGGGKNHKVSAEKMFLTMEII